MKFQYLGTAAAEGFPAVFCNCEYCKVARKLKGKNIRTRSQSIIDDKLLIDLPADTYMHMLKFDLELDKVNTLLITHSHMDHLYSEELQNHAFCYAKNLREEVLDVVCSQDTFNRIKYSANRIHEEVLKTLNFKILKSYETILVNGYKITALPARHMKDEECFIYLIEKDNKKMLYAHDTGYFHEGVINYLKDNSVSLDFVSFDCTCVLLEVPDNSTHMGLSNIKRLKEELSNLNIINKNTKLYINHFSHNVNPLHERLEKLGIEYGVNVSYDGLTIDI